MEENFKKIETFFKLNLSIKKELLRVAPNESDNYNMDTRIKYGDRLYFSLQDIEGYFLNILELLNLSSLEPQIKKMFQHYNQELLKCDYSFQKLADFYKTNFSDMQMELIDKVNYSFVGYTMFGGQIGLVLSSAKTINELLHIFHAYLINNENIYQRTNVIAKKLITNGEEITLYGRANNISQAIFDEFPLDLDVGITDILSFQNKILIMIRDKGHALTIEIDFDNDKSLIRYFIPKICNPLKVNELKGINKVTRNVRFASGVFECDTIDLPKELYNFIENVPTDDDMFTYGGWQYEETLEDFFPRRTN